MTTNFKFCVKCQCETARSARGICNPCEAKRVRAWVAKNPDKKKASDAAYLKKNPEAVAARRQAWRAANPDKQNAAEAAYRQRNRDRLREYRNEWLNKNEEWMKAWRAASAEMFRAHNATRRAKKRNAGGRHTKADIKQLLTLQHEKCAACKANIKDGYHVDHVMPLALGGGNGPENLQLLCPPCNLSKNAKHPVDFMQEKGYLL